jgi:hypothetical protein
MSKNKGGREIRKPKQPKQPKIATEAGVVPKVDAAAKKGK